MSISDDNAYEKRSFQYQLRKVLGAWLGFWVLDLVLNFANQLELYKDKITQQFALTVLARHK